MRLLIATAIVATAIVLLPTVALAQQISEKEQLTSFQAELIGPGWATAITTKNNKFKVFWPAHPELEPGLRALLRQGDLMVRDGGRLWLTTSASLKRIHVASPELEEFLQTNTINHMALVNNLNTMFNTERRKIHLKQGEHGWDVTYVGRPGLEVPLEVLLNNGKAIRKDGAPFIQPLASGELLGALNHQAAYLQPMVARNRKVAHQVRATIAPAVKRHEQQLNGAHGVLAELRRLEREREMPAWLVPATLFSTVGVVVLAVLIVLNWRRPKPASPERRPGRITIGGPEKRNRRGRASGIRVLAVCGGALKRVGTMCTVPFRWLFLRRKEPVAYGFEAGGALVHTSDPVRRNGRAGQPANLDSPVLPSDESHRRLLSLVEGDRET